MDARTEIRDFLTSRRDRITPQQAGLPRYGGKRRVPGLRRSELATLAGISVEYLTQLERGNAAGASDSVLNALSTALQLDDAERTHLFDLARAVSGPRGTSARGRTTQVRPSIQRILDTLGSPAYARTRRGDIVAVNAPCTALYGDTLTASALPLNVARFVFLDPRSRDFFLDWETVADDTAASLRIEAGRTPSDRLLSDLVGELATRSDAFAERWGKHNVRLHHSATKRLHNAIVGDLELTGDALQVPGEDLTLIVYTAPAGTPSARKARLPHPLDRPTQLHAACRIADRPRLGNLELGGGPQRGDGRARACHDSSRSARRLERARRDPRPRRAPSDSASVGLGPATSVQNGAARRGSAPLAGRPAPSPSAGTSAPNTRYR